MADRLSTVHVARCALVHAVRRLSRHGIGRKLAQVLVLVTVQPVEQALADAAEFLVDCLQHDCGQEPQADY
jgi:hypothetical protein